MAEFKTVMRERKRMCSQLKCRNCRLSFDRNGHDVDCARFLREYPEEVEDIVMQWAAENPFKTNGDKFREVFGYDFTKVVCAADWYNAEYKEENENG